MMNVTHQLHHEETRNCLRCKQASHTAKREVSNKTTSLPEIQCLKHSSWFKVNCSIFGREASAELCSLPLLIWLRYNHRETTIIKQHRTMMSSWQLPLLFPDWPGWNLFEEIELNGRNSIWWPEGKWESNSIGQAGCHLELFWLVIFSEGLQVPEEIRTLVSIPSSANPEPLSPELQTCNWFNRRNASIMNGEENRYFVCVQNGRKWQRDGWHWRDELTQNCF